MSRFLVLARMLVVVGLAWAAFPAPSAARSPFTPSSKTSPKPTIGVTGKPVPTTGSTPPGAKPPKIEAPVRQTPSLGGSAPPARPSSSSSSSRRTRTPGGLPERFGGAAEARNKATKGDAATGRRSTRPGDASPPAKGGAGPKAEGGSSWGPTPGERGGAIDGVRLGGSDGDASGASDSGGNDNPVRALRNSRVSDGDHVWGALDFDEAHSHFLGSPGFIDHEDGRNVRINAGTGPDGDWVLVHVSDTTTGEQRRYEYVNGSLVQTERIDADGNKTVTKIDPSTGTETTTVECPTPPCNPGRVNPDDVPRGERPPQAGDPPDRPSRFDTLVNHGPDGGLPDVRIDPDALPDPDAPLVNPSRDGSPPRGTPAAEADPASTRQGSLIQWGPDGPPNDDPPPASPGAPSGSNPKGKAGKGEAAGEKKGSGARDVEGRRRPAGPARR